MRAGTKSSSFLLTHFSAPSVMAEPHESSLFGGDRSDLTNVPAPSSTSQLRHTMLQIMHGRVLGCFRSHSFLHCSPCSAARTILETAARPVIVQDALLAGNLLAAGGAKAPFSVLNLVPTR